jgi:hypothetical protein
MAKRKVGNKPSSKKAGNKKNGLRPLEQDPPIIVGGGASIIISIRKDLGLQSLGTSGNYKRYRCRYVDALYLDVYEDSSSLGNGYALDPGTHEAVYWDIGSFANRRSFKRSRK